MSKELNKAPVEQAGGDEREEFEKIHTVPRGIMWNEEKSQYVRVHEKHCSLRTWNSFVALWAGWMARAALAQPSPKSGYYSDQEWINAGCPPEQPSPAQAEQAEVERPEVVAVARIIRNDTPQAFMEAIPVFDTKGPFEEGETLMKVAQHERIVGALRAELEKQEPVDVPGPDEIHQMAFEEGQPAEDGDGYLFSAEEFDLFVQRLLDSCATPVAQAQQLHDLDKQCRDDVARALGLRPSQERGFAWSYLLASIKSCVKASEDAAQAQHSVPIAPEFKRALGLVVAALEADGDRPTSKYALSELKKVLADAPGKEVGHE
ncbi:TPA: hypothetical protein L4S00_002653 [Pseudomonas aeruginosa]|nr:hypothetical protein [Pseudomonas aeruginosa]HBO4700053.1 hypothetical protein [Pseudomonas aeruginosa]